MSVTLLFIIELMTFNNTEFNPSHPGFLQILVAFGCKKRVKNVEKKLASSQEILTFINEAQQISKMGRR